jgi:hypothetical protein
MGTHSLAVDDAIVAMNNGWLKRAQAAERVLSA